MKISNKLTTKDIVDLQKNLLNYYSLSGGIKFFTKYIVNLLYGIFTFILLYFIFLKMGKANIYIPIAMGLLTFIVLVFFHDRLYKYKMNGLINKTYGRENYDINRVVTFNDSSIIISDENKEDREFFYSNMLDYIKDSNSKRYVILNDNSGVVFKLDDLSEDEVKKVDSYFNKIGKKA